MRVIPEGSAALAKSVLVILFPAVMLAVLPSLSDAAESFKMGVVDPQSVLEKSKAGKRALDTLKEYASTRQKLLAGELEIRLDPPDWLILPQGSAQGPAGDD